MPKQKRHKQPKLKIIVDLPNESNRKWYDEKYRNMFKDRRGVLHDYRDGMSPGYCVAAVEVVS